MTWRLKVFQTFCNIGRLYDGGNQKTWKTFTSSRWTASIDPDAAERYYRAALALDSEHVPTLVNFGYFLEYVSFWAEFPFTGTNPHVSADSDFEIPRS